VVLLGLWSPVLENSLLSLSLPGVEFSFLGGVYHVFLNFILEAAPGSLKAPVAFKILGTT